MIAESIDEVIHRLGRIVEDEKERNSPAGYFAALYRTVTEEVAEGIAKGEFDDGARMERLDVVFANRYLEAYVARRAGEPVTESWRLAFDAGRDWWSVVLQHLLLGMNAHINLDLGIATARAAASGDLSALRGDFLRINAILAGLVDRVQDGLASIWPLLRILDHTAASTDEALINFAMGEARDHAWSVAERLARLPRSEQDHLIRGIDRSVATFGGRVRNPGWWIGTLLKAVRLGERGSVSEKIRILETIA